MDLFTSIIFGHVVGDFFLQPAWMATKKGSSNKLCVIHCFIYTMSIILFTAPKYTINESNLFWFVFIFVSHFLVDRFSLGDKWLQLIGGRDLQGFIENGNRNIPSFRKEIDKQWCTNNTDVLGSFTEVEAEKENEDRKLNYRILRGGFSCICYVIVDNFMHIIPTYYVYKLIYL